MKKFKDFIFEKKEKMDYKGTEITYEVRKKKAFFNVINKDGNLSDQISVPIKTTAEEAITFWLDGTSLNKG